MKNTHSFFIFLFIISLCAACREESRPLAFPEDHGPHFDARAEWWYFTGDTVSSGGRRLGFECTIFKGRDIQGKGPGFIGHVAVIDPEQPLHSFSETATAPPVNGLSEGIPEIQIDDFYYCYSEETGFTVQGTGDTVGIAVTLVPEKPVLLHGGSGMITMGDGLESYYYSHTNLSTSGTITHNGIDYPIISGRTWMDHQWGNFTAFGLFWDWFSLRFDEGGALMLFRFRNAAGTSVRSNWTYRDADDKIAYGELFAMQASRVYEDDSGRCAYPLEWHINVPGIQQDLFVRPLFDSQALYSSMLPDYWEGLCSFEGTLEKDIIITGSAYVELTGYCRGW